MSMQIDPERIANEELTFLEAKYLQDRGQLPADYPFPENDADDEEGEPQPLPTRVTPLEEQDVPTMGRNGGIVDDDEEEDYEDGWNNDQRRAELSTRGLSVDGKKDDLIARLRRSDLDELEDGDIFEADSED
jgi:hypothetical protein